MVTSEPSRVTRADVARYAGVSSAVVSYVVNDGPRPVAAATAARVREAIRVLGYRPNASAQALRTGSSKLLGLIVPELTNTFWAELAVEAGAAARARGFDLIVGSSEGDVAVEQQHLRSLSARQVDGIMLVSGMARADLTMVAYMRPRIVLLSMFYDVPHVASIGVDAYQGAYDGTTHLVDHGYESIGLIIGGSGGLAVELRESGWQSATRDAGLPDGPIARTTFSRQGGYEAALRMFGGPSRPRAVFVSSEMQAVGVLKALFELGLQVPNDVALVAFDGTIEGEFTNPQLTSVQQPVREMAELAIDRLLDHSDSPDPGQAVLASTLAVRGSCGVHALA